MTLLKMTEHEYNEIKTHLLFFISNERMFASTLYEMIKLSPGNWFDIEELAERKSIKDISTNMTVICDIIKTLPEFEYNDQSIIDESLSGNIRLFLKLDKFAFRPCLLSMTSSMREP